jgi:hypothetical protein
VTNVGSQESSWIFWYALVMLLRAILLVLLV